MGYIWNETINPGDVVDAYHVEEMMVNTDDARGLVGLGAYAWNRTPVPGNIIYGQPAIDYHDIRDAIDEAFDARPCVSHNAAHDSGDDASHNSVDDIAHYTGDDTSDHGVDDAANLTADDTADDSGHNTVHDGTALISHDISHLGANYGGNCPSFNSANYGAAQSSIVLSDIFPCPGQTCPDWNAAKYNPVSDERLKEDIHTVDNALDIVDQLRGVFFNFKDLDSGLPGVASGKQCGVIAQELQKILPDLVVQNGEYLTVNYMALTGIFIEAIKDLRKNGGNGSE